MVKIVSVKFNYSMKFKDYDIIRLVFMGFTILNNAF